MRTFLRILLVPPLLLTACKKQPGTQVGQPVEIRGVWLTNVDSHVLDSQESIAEAMEFLAKHHFNIVFPVVWNKGMTQYPSAIMDSLFGIRIDTNFIGRDPLAELIAEAHQRNIAVVPWFEFGFSSSYKENGGHIIAKKPHWAARDGNGRLLTKNGFEWMNAYHPEVQEFILSLVMEVVNGYDVDGVQGDDRLPAQPIEGGYSRVTRQLYRLDHAGAEPPADPRDREWQRWRAGKLSAFAERIYKAVKAAEPDVIVSWAPSAFPWGYDEYLQDWPAWISNGCADLVIPQVYRYTLEEYRQTLDSQSPDSLKLRSGGGVIYPGILMNVGEYLMSEEYLLGALAYNRERGYNGEVFFFYEGLRKNHNRLADALLSSLYKAPASLPFKTAPQISQ